MKTVAAIIVLLIAFSTHLPMGEADVVPNAGNLLVRNLSSGSGSTCTEGGIVHTYAFLTIDVGILAKYVPVGNCTYDVYVREGNSTTSTIPGYVTVAVHVLYDSYNYLDVQGYNDPPLTHSCPSYYGGYNYTDDPDGFFELRSTDCWSADGWYASLTERKFYWEPSQYSGTSIGTSRVFVTEWGTATCEFAPSIYANPPPQAICATHPRYVPNLGPDDMATGSWGLVGEDLLPGEVREIDL